MTGFRAFDTLSRPIGRRAVLGGLGALSGGLGAAAMGRRPPRDAPDQTRWTFDRLANIGGVATSVEGDPRLIDSPYGKAVWFDGVDDRLVIDRHPLAGMSQFTFEALFRPDGGVFAQRWFHLNEEDPTPGAPPRSKARCRTPMRTRSRRPCRRPSAPDARRRRAPPLGPVRRREKD